MRYNQLTEVERYQIYSLLKTGMKPSGIAEHLGRHASTIGRELKRNRGLRGYRPRQAQRLAKARQVQAAKRCKLTADVKGMIVALLRQELSPEQVTGYLSRHHQIKLHHETVYQLIYADRAQGGDLYRHMRVVSKPYRKRYGRYGRRGRIKDRVSIEARPDIVASRSRLGDWEGDTVIGKDRKGALLTLVERQTLYTIIVKLAGKQADALAQAAIGHMQGVKGQVKTITFDNGLEFAHHKAIAEGLGVDIYFAHPYASWERGCNENTNGLIRQYFPKGSDFSLITDEDLKFVMDRLNNRPRKTRGYRSPNELFWGQPANLLAA